MMRGIIALILLSVTAFADSGMKIPGEKDSCSNWRATSVWDDAVDCVIIRPVDFVLLGGVAFPLYAVSAPFAAMADDEKEMYEGTVKTPANYIFDREIGDIYTPVESYQSR